MTNEHVVRYPTQISVQPYESAERIPATVLAVSPEMDLAVIELDTDEAFAGLEPPAFDERLPKLRTTVRVNREGSARWDVSRCWITPVASCPGSGKSSKRQPIERA